MDLQKRFEEYVVTENLFTKKDVLLIAVSGGVDSVVLCELCHRAGYQFIITHCNFQLRGTESDEDEQFVEGLAKKYGVKYFVKKFDTRNAAVVNKTGIQETARDLRYEWFGEILHGLNFQPANSKAYLLTAHHANDNIETVLMNFFKGTGINGMIGIRSIHDHIRRPLLFAMKEDIRRFANDHSITYREDSSNSHDDYTRNQVRNQLMPVIEKIFPAAGQGILGNIERLGGVHSLFNKFMNNIRTKLMIRSGDDIQIPVLRLQSYSSPHTILYEIIKDFGFSAGQLESVSKLLQSESGKYVESASHRILRNRKWLIISAIDGKPSGYIVLEQGMSEQSFAAGVLRIKELSKDGIKKDELIAQVDAKHLKWPVLLRKWKKGDYFYPLGLRKASGKPGRKKLSRFFIDQKFSINEKENTWVLESNKKIIWVVGKRLDDRFKITEQTKDVIRFTLVPK